MDYTRGWPIGETLPDVTEEAIADLIEKEM